MKKVLLFIAKMFNVDITETRIVEKPVIKYIEKEVIKYKLPVNEVLTGNVYVDGNLTIRGSLVVRGEISVFTKSN